jgi:hypothetical protein
LTFKTDLGIGMGMGSGSGSGIRIGIGAAKDLREGGKGRLSLSTERLNIGHWIYKVDTTAQYR